MLVRHRAVAWSALVLLGAGCGSSASGGDSMVHVAEAEDIRAFGDLLTHWSDVEFEPPRDLADAVESVPFVVLGTVVDLQGGRREWIAGEGADVIYASYVDVVVEPHQLTKGTLAEEGELIHVEFAYPNNADVEELAGLAPIGSRVIVLMDRVEGAHEAAVPLVEAGVFDADSLPQNLFSCPPYGMLVEAADGEVVLPLEKVGHPSFALDPQPALSSFAAAAEAVGGAPW